MYKYFTYLLLASATLFSTGTASGQQLLPPVITCIELNDNGDVLVNWDPVADPGGYFTQYNILSSPNTGGPFMSEGTETTLAGSSFLDTGNPAPPTAPTYYQIVTHSSDGTNTYNSSPSLTVGCIFLTAMPSTNPLGFATLNWNSPYPVNTPAPAGIMYEVWMERGGTWSMVQTLPFGVTNWSYEIVEMCDEALKFQIRLTIPSGCTFLSNTPGGIYRDLISPDIPTITSVTINHTIGRGVINWEPSAAADTKGYLVYKCQGTNPTTTTLIGTLMGQNTTQFTDMVTTTATGPVQYAIAAFDSCYLLTPPMVPASPIGACSRSIFLQGPNYTNCDDFVHLNWQPYDGWVFGVDNYVIYHGFSTVPPGPGVTITYTPIGTVSGNTFTFIHHGIPQQDGFNSYYIEGTASQTGYTAKSNLQNVFVTYPAAPAYVYLGSASVMTIDSTRITVDIAPTTFPHEYRLQRYGINSGLWMDISAQSVSATPFIEFFDKGLSNDVLSYDYRVVVKNGCGAYVDTTNIGTTMVIDGVANTDLFINLVDWTDYGDWDNGVASYRVYREIDDNGTEELVGELNPGANRPYQDDVSNLLFTKGKFCYRIEAVEAPTSPSGIEHTARSYEICVNQDPVIWIPNSFVVGGVNNTFSPVISFANFETYRMIIFSRWGDIVYDTDDITAPWDGMFEGTTAQQGAYVYFITIKDGLGRAIEKRGMVNLLVQKGIR